MNETKGAILQCNTLTLKIPNNSAIKMKQRKYYFLKLQNINTKKNLQIVSLILIEQKNDLYFVLYFTDLI